MDIKKILLEKADMSDNDETTNKIEQTSEQLLKLSKTDAKSLDELNNEINYIEMTLYIMLQMMRKIMEHLTELNINNVEYTNQSETPEEEDKNNE